MKRIVKGNDFTLRIPVMKQVDGQKVPFPIPACTDVQVRVCNQFRRTELAYEVDVADDNVILARVEGDKMAVGTYAVEVRGKLMGNDWRSEEYPQFQIVARNADADTEFGETDGGDNSVEMDTALVILPPSVDLTDAIGDAKEAVAKAEEAIESAAATSATIGAAEAERAKAENQRESQETARQEAEAARVTAEQARAEAEQKREADTNAAVAKCEQAVADAMVAVEYSPDDYGIIITTGKEADNGK